MTTYLTLEGDTLDLICFNHYGRDYGKVVERVRTFNQNLSRLILPAGFLIKLPALQKNSVNAKVSLWD